MGVPGFGWEKIMHKHGITNVNLVEKLIENPNGGTERGTRPEYAGFAQRFSCDISGRCTEVERIPLIAVVEFKDVPEMGGQLGVVTAYCEIGRDDCPSWVNRT